jgi:hypothetical protein
VKKILSVALLLSVAGSAQAHYLWVERDAGGAARGYYGEWQNSLIEKSGANLERIANPKAFQSDANAPLKIARAADHFDIGGAKGHGDVRLTDMIYAEARKTRSFYYAKGGRQDAAAVFDLEFVPVAPGSNQFTLLWKGAPLPKAAVSVYGPPKWQRELDTDEQGRVTIDTPWMGRYIVETIRTEERKDPADEVRRQVATVSFTVERGIRWSSH